MRCRGRVKCRCLFHSAYPRCSFSRGAVGETAYMFFCIHLRCEWTISLWLREQVDLSNLVINQIIGLPM